jgi:hypothetical protein
VSNGQFAAKRRHPLELIFESNLGFEQLVAQFSIVGALSLQASRIHCALFSQVDSIYAAKGGRIDGAADEVRNP